MRVNGRWRSNGGNDGNTVHVFEKIKLRNLLIVNLKKSYMHICMYT